MLLHKCNHFVTYCAPKRRYYTTYRTFPQGFTGDLKESKGNLRNGHCEKTSSRTTYTVGATLAVARRRHLNNMNKSEAKSYIYAISLRIFIDSSARATARVAPTIVRFFHSPFTIRCEATPLFRKVSEAILRNLKEN